MKIPRIAFAAYGFAVVIIVLDQLTKAWVLNTVGPEYEGFLATVVPSLFRISVVHNDGVSFGLFGGGAARWGLTVFQVAVAAGLAWWVTRIDRRLLITAMGLVMGGAVGNVIDRIRFGFVMDFLDFSDIGFKFVFNIADSAITIGVVLLMLDLYLSERAAKVGVAAEKS